MLHPSSPPEVTPTSQHSLPLLACESLPDKQLLILVLSSTVSQYLSVTAAQLLVRHVAEACS